MENIVRTVNGALLQTCQLVGLPYTVHPNTTLNEKFGVQTQLTITQQELPRARYLAIGNGGHRMAMGPGNIPYPDMLQHRPRDMALFNHLPLVMRELDGDLTAAERSKYRMRRIEQHGGAQYAAYYLKLLDFAETVPTVEYRSVQDGTVYSSDFQATLGDLSPTPVEPSDVGVTITTGDYVAATAKVDFTMNSFDIQEFLNVTNILYGNANMGVISEFAVCSGVDRVVTGLFDGVSSNYTEVIAAQVVSFIYEFFVVKTNKTNISMSLDIGAAESMLNLQGVAT